MKGVGSEPSGPVSKEGSKELILREEAGISWCKGPEAALSPLDGGDGVEKQVGWITRG